MNKNKNIRICTLTHHTVPNYGAVLQTYALQRAISDLGYGSEVLDYRSQRVNENYFLKFPVAGTLKMKICYLLFSRKCKKRGKMFDSFIMENVTLSKKSYSRQQLKDSEDLYDLFIVGSDQVWNLRLHQNDTTYMLDFLNNTEKKGSYAASFGYEAIPSEYLKNSLKWLSDFKYYNVREKSGEKILENQIGVDKNSINTVVDPTLLLDKNVWMTFVANEETDYILLYDLIDSGQVKEFTQKLAELVKIPIRVIKPSSTKIGPKEFVSLFYNAKYVVTTSFHGMAFSIIFNKQFYYGLNKSSRNNNSRLIDLSSDLGLNNQCIDQIKEIDTNQKINYKTVNKLLSELRNNSIEVLNKMIMDCGANKNEYKKDSKE